RPRRRGSRPCQRPPSPVGNGLRAVPPSCRFAFLPPHVLAAPLQGATRNGTEAVPYLVSASLVFVAWAARPSLALFSSSSLRVNGFGRPAFGCLSRHFASALSVSVAVRITSGSFGRSAGTASSVHVQSKKRLFRSGFSSCSMT